VVDPDAPIHTAVILQVVYSVTDWRWTQTLSTVSTVSQWRVHVITESCHDITEDHWTANFRKMKQEKNTKA